MRPIRNWYFSFVRELCEIADCTRKFHWFTTWLYYLSSQLCESKSNIYLPFNPHLEKHTRTLRNSKISPHIHTVLEQQTDMLSGFSARSWRKISLLRMQCPDKALVVAIIGTWRSALVNSKRTWAGSVGMYPFYGIRVVTQRGRSA